MSVPSYLSLSLFLSSQLHQPVRQRLSSPVKHLLALPLPWSPMNFANHHPQCYIPFILVADPASVRRNQLYINHVYSEKSPFYTTARKLLPLLSFPFHDDVIYDLLHVRNNLSFQKHNSQVWMPMNAMNAWISKSSHEEDV